MKSFTFLFFVLFSFALVVPTSPISADGGDPNHYHMWESGDKCDGYNWVCAEPWADDCTKDDQP